MSYFYGLLAVTGWVWAAIIGVFLFVKLRRSSGAPRGFEVETSETKDAQQH